MKDRAEKELVAGDYILYHLIQMEPSHPTKVLCQIVEVKNELTNPYAIVSYTENGERMQCDVSHSKNIEKITEDQAMIFMLEGN